EITVPAETGTSSAMLRWPRITAAAPSVQRLPMSALPATATQPAMAVCAPTRTLWPIWIWLSSFTPSSSTVSSSAPRSMVVLAPRSEEHTSELQSPDHLVCRLLLEKKKNKQRIKTKEVNNSDTYRSILLS